MFWSRHDVKGGTQDRGEVLNLEVLLVEDTEDVLSDLVRGQEWSACLFLVGHELLKARFVDFLVTTGCGRFHGW